MNKTQRSYYTSNTTYYSPSVLSSINFQFRSFSEVETKSVSKNMVEKTSSIERPPDYNLVNCKHLSQDKIHPTLSSNNAEIIPAYIPLNQSSIIIGYVIDEDLNKPVGKMSAEIERKVGLELSHLVTDFEFEKLAGTEKQMPLLLDYEKSNNSYFDLDGEELATIDYKEYLAVPSEKFSHVILAIPFLSQTTFKPRQNMSAGKSKESSTRMLSSKSSSETNIHSSRSCPVHTKRQTPCAYLLKAFGWSRKKTSEQTSISTKNTSQKMVKRWKENDEEKVKIAARGSLTFSCEQEESPEATLFNHHLQCNVNIDIDDNFRMVINKLL